MYGVMCGCYIRSDQDLTDASQNYTAYDDDEIAEDDITGSFIISKRDIVPRNKRAEHPTSYVSHVQDFT